jgi:hypothetical protein
MTRSVRGAGAELQAHPTTAATMSNARMPEL